MGCDMTATPQTAAIRAAIQRARDEAPFLRMLIDCRPELVALLESGDVQGALAAATAASDADTPLGTALRIERQGLALVLAIADIAGAMPLEDVVLALSDLADRALDKAVAEAIAERTPGEEPRGFAVIALGKHGSRELNYSSDIDPILLFDPDTLPRRAREEPVEAAVRIGRRVVELLQARDGNGHVFRVDLRLRPSPEATPIALPVDAAIGYYESSALAWERAAFIRSRAAAGDIALGERFLEAIRPFVWRRALDFGAVTEIRGISRRIRDHHARGQLFGPGFDLKRGRGGIREVEFFAQIHQLIHGGREPELRVPATMPALRALADAGRIPADEATTLIDAYRLFRTIEHRLQMIDDQQTHSLPAGDAEMDAVARLHGVGDGGALLDLLRPHVEKVGTIYDALDDDDEASGLPREPEGLRAALADAGFDDPVNAAARIESWRSGTIRALRSEAAREALESMLPGLVQAMGGAPDPAAAINRLDDIIGRLPSAINFFRLLEARPALARMLGDILSHAPTLAQSLGRRPELLDGLIDATALDPPGSIDQLVDMLAAGEADDDYQMLLDRTRQRVNEKRFALGVQLIEAAADPLDVSAGYARVAEAALVHLTQATIDDFRCQHGTVPGSDFVVLALGRLGGQALTHASDLDLIYLFTGDHAAMSDGNRPIDATRYYNRLAQRVTAALSVPTASGPLYEVDTRLRPSGAQGLLAVSVDSFARYQQENAWTWEHMALTRARPVFGPAAVKAELGGLLSTVLAAPRDVAAMTRDAVKMRADMAAHKPPAGPLDAKLIDGGLVDLEFCVHVTQLRHLKGLDPSMPAAIGALVDAGLLPAAFAGAHDVLSRLLVTLRLVAPDAQEPAKATRALIARACRAENWDALLAAYANARQIVSTEWRRIVAESEE
jgi:glutamate-ammonia-ligase adenylyltransferase